MKSLFLASLTIGLLLVARAERIPVEDFAHEEAFNGMVLSPDGKIVAYDETIKGNHRLFMLDLDTRKKLGIDLEGSNVAWAHNSEFFWVNNRRLMFRAHGSYAAIDRDGKNASYYLPGANALHLFRDEEAGMILATGYEVAVGNGMRFVSYYVPERPYIMKVNPRFETRMRVVDNPGNVVAWGVNPQGEATVAVEIRGTQYRAVYRVSEKASWETLPGMDWTDPQVRPQGFSKDGKTLYVSRVTPAGTWGIYPYDLNKKTLGEPILANEKFDIIPGYGRAAANGYWQQLMVYAEKEKELLGIRYMTEYPKMLWLDPAMAELQAALNQALPKKINTITSMSDDRQRFIVYSWTASDPGAFYLFDRQAGRLEKLMARMPWIDPEKMAEVKPVRFKARDGIMLNGYLTVPQGKEMKNLPLVVLVDDNVWGRAVWQFDRQAQFLANRGYAVLRISQRGVSGYGENLRLSGYKKLAAEMQFDLADGARWAIQQKIADPKRVGILGIGSTGGAIALMGLVAEPEVYCCGMASAPFTDWVKVIDKRDMDDDMYAYFTERVGNPKTDPDAVRALSPLYQADKIKAPVMIMHNKNDIDWAYNQSKALAAALKKAGREVELINEFEDDRYGYQRYAKWLTDLETFLAKHMPADK